MDRDAFREIARGNCIPLVTPFHSDFSLDVKSLRQQVRRLLDAGYRTGNAVLLAGGAAGEFPSMSLDERKRVAETVVEEASERIGVLVGGQGTNVLDILEMARFCERIGASALQISAPYYEPPARDDIFAVFKMIADAADIPLVVYNTFWTGPHSHIPHDDVGELLEIANVAGLKWASPEMHDYERVLRSFAHRVAIIDNQVCEIYSQMMGAVGFVAHHALFWPDYSLKLWQCLEEQRYAEVLEMLKQFRIPCTTLLFKAYQLNGCEGHFDKIVLSLLGEPVGPPRPPGRPLSREFHEQVWQMLHDAGVPGLKHRPHESEHQIPVATA